MARVVFRNRMNYSRWIVIGTVIAVAFTALGLFTGEIAPMFYVMGGGWLVVLAFVALIIQGAGSGQVAQLSIEEPTVVIESNGLTGHGLPRAIPRSEIGNWRVLTQGAGSQKVGPKLGMLAFNHGRKTYRLPMTTAQAVDVAGLRELAPEAVDALVEQFPELASRPMP
jgi:hypothetical protein